jgi:type VI secretion system secreted protein Hcp
MPDIIYTPRDYIASETAVRGADYALELKSNGSQIKGGLVKGDTDGLIGITQWENRIITQRDASTGLSSGRRVHFGIHMIGPISQAAPLIFRALINNEAIEAKLKCYRQRETTRENHFTITVKRARIGSYETMTSPLDGSLLYDFVIIYQNVNYTWVQGGIEAEDDWHGQES